MKRISLAVGAVLALVLAGSAAFGATAADRAVYQKLDTMVVSFTFSEQPLEEAIDFLQTLAGANIVLDKRKVEAGKTVTLKLQNAELVTAIKLITEQVGLKWVVRDGVIFISDEEGTKLEPVTVVYDVSDLLTVPPNYQGPDIELQSISASRGGTSGGGSGASIFASEEDTSGGAEAKKSQEELLTELVDLIKQVIAPGTWEE